MDFVCFVIYYDLFFFNLKKTKKNRLYTDKNCFPRVSSLGVTKHRENAMLKENKNKVD